MVGGGKDVDLSTVIKGDARVFVLIADEADAVAARDLGLPGTARVICYYRDGKFAHPDERTTFRVGDEIVILTHSKNLPALQERWPAKQENDEAAGMAAKKGKKPAKESKGVRHL
jgi:trk system potassium uptake protein TrkA